jgi:hypothetical protein
MQAASARSAIALPAIAALGVLAGCTFSVGFDSDPVVEPLQITRQPQSTTVIAGQPASFIVGVAGGGRISFQWQRNGVAILGATGSAYTTPPTTIADDGSPFTVRVCDELVCVTSLPALLTLLRSG